MISSKWMMGATWKCNGHRVWCCRNDLFSNKTTARREFFVCLPMLRICNKTLQSLMIWITCTSKTIAPSTLEYHSSPTRKSSAHCFVLFHKNHYSLPFCHRLHCINDRSEKTELFMSMEHVTPWNSCQLSPWRRLGLLRLLWESSNPKM